MPRLRDRNHQIPNGYRFGLPEANWKAPPFASFEQIVNLGFRIVQANPALATAKGWPQTREDFANWVDEFNAQICAMNGWTNYISDGGSVWSPPKPVPLSAVKNVAAGAKTLASWIAEGATPVTREMAEGRALVCSKCPLNQPGDLSNFFTRATSELIRMQIQTAQDLDLTTPYDSKLGVCGACACPMRLKVFVPLEKILDHMLPEAKAALSPRNPRCWILLEDATENPGADGMS